MFWRSNRKQTKGWAFDIEQDGPYGGIWERIASNSKAWLFCAIILLVCIVLVFVRSDNLGRDSSPLDLVESPVGTYTDRQHQAFEQTLVRNSREHGISTKARFLSDRTFQITILSDVGQNEIAYVSRFAALGIYRHFKVSPTVWTYIKGQNHPVATTTWGKSRGDFVVRFADDTG